MRNAMYSEVYTVEEVAAIFRIPKRTVRRLIHRGELPAIRLGRLYRVPKAVIDEMFALAPVPEPPEEFGFGMWKADHDIVDAVAYVDRLRDADPRSLRELVSDLSTGQT